jgi:homoserine O-acetyltransferase
MHEKFGRELRKAEKYSYDFNSEFAVETYLDHQGQRFVERFDANSYLYITKAMDYFDLARDYGSLKSAFAKTESRFLIVSFTSDWLFTPAQSEDMVDALVADGKDVSYCNIETPYGHDAFLLEPAVLGKLISGFLDRTHEIISGQSKTAEKKTDEIARDKPTDQQGIRVRVDYEIIESLIESDSRVLDIGCGDGKLLARLSHDKNIKGECIELAEDLVISCVGQGLPAIQRDIDRGLANYADKSFDYVILSQTLQTLKDPKQVFTEMLRIGKKVIVSFPNFAHWRCRLELAFTGKAPQTRQLPFTWYDSPNVHFLSLKDFDRFCRELGIRIERKIPLIKTRLSPVRFAPNLFAEQVVYVTSKN